MRGIARHYTYPHRRINMGSTRVESFCKSELYFVIYGLLFERLDSVSRHGNKALKNSRIFHIYQFFSFCLIAYDVRRRYCLTRDFTVPAHFLMVFVDTRCG